MIFFKKHKGLITGALVMVILLTISFFLPTSPEPKRAPVDLDMPVVIDTNTSQTKSSAKTTGSYNEEKTIPIIEETMPSEQSTSEPAENVDVTHKLTCTLSVTCHTILDNMHKIKEEKKQIIPPNGVIFSPKEVEFYEDETAFNVLLREMKQNRIHFEYEYTPMYDSIYIEGIGNIYEFDAGDLSGWLYRVNGSFLNYSLSEYTLKNGDKIEIIYTCNMGADVGGAYPSLQ